MELLKSTLKINMITAFERSIIQVNLELNSGHPYLEEILFWVQDKHIDQHQYTSCMFV